MIALILSLIPAKTLVLLGGGLATFLGLFIRGKMDKVAAENAKVELAKAISANHAVEQKESAAETDEEADAALDLDADSARG